MTDICEIVEEFWDELDSSPYVMIGIPSQNAHSIPMHVAFDKTELNTLFLYTKTGNRLVEGMARDPMAMAQFVSKNHDFFACLHGRLSRVEDRAVIDRFWSNAVEAWYEGGKEDPALVMLRFDIRDTEMWEADMSVKGMFKLLTGKTIEPEEAGAHAELAM
ncbi:MAG: pyridoxamine 5'-phosphate oxidase family protein [Parasphingopyxis sp.]|uniref:pyridoxamine 5'-phosphate oxidase family protein n=1 Tax=Parasphingopyxis sp. TaxID=1920299 RepID=UPI003F9FF288